ncbi:complement receptor type 1-like [Clavelina lepadiformis]|uniref:complement receptor type 1-like n=1 Tax=Clavelina lepadiformis TaxID=159417 RepID=UPI00404322CB
MLYRLSLVNYAAVALLILTTAKQASAQCPARNVDALEEGRTCRKQCTDDASCRGALKTCNCDGVCGMTCFNLGAECETPANLRFGEIIGDERTYNKSIYYRCREGYILHGNEKRTCRSDKKWTGSPPECRPGCTTPPRFGGSFPEETKGTYNLGETVTYSCLFGRTLSGNPEISCQRDGWSTPLFLCRRRQCKDPEDVAHATVRSSAPDKGFYEFGDRAFYECEIGYELSQRQNFVNCNTRGEWQGTFPSCNIIECQAPIAPEHGFIEDNGIAYEYGNEVTYSCGTEYKLEGNSNGRCNENGDWGEVPTCVVDKDCDFQDSRRPTCGYFNLAGRWTRTFSRNVPIGLRGYVARASFSSFDPNLEARLVSPDIPRTQPLCLKFYYFLDQISLDRDFVVEMVDSSGRRSEIWRPDLRDPKKRWLNTDIEFDRSDENLKIEFRAGKSSRSALAVDLDEITITENETCVDECRPRPCRNGGTCLNRIDAYKCYCLRGYEGDNCEIKIECVVPRAPSFGSVKPPRYSRVALDKTITYSCGRKYRLVGTSRATCEEDRTFTSPPPRCDEITCPRRTTPADATPSSFKSRWLVDDVLSYTCDVGYDLRGNPSSTCLVTGRWSNTLPYCRIRRCVHRDVPQHSTANPNKSQWVYGDRVTYTCDRGYELSGSAESRCTSSRRWSDPPPTCTIRSCEHPTPPRNVDKIRPANKMSWVYEDTITYGCSRGYRLNGVRTLSCTEDGTWSHPVPTCQQITCERSDPDFGESIPGKERYIFEEKITYSCNDGFDLEGAIRSICEASGSWNNDPPNCYLPDRNPCPPGYTEKFPFCFRRFNERQNFQDATETCHREGATLPIIRDNHVRDKFVEMLHDDRELWIGISDEGKEGVLKWQNGDLYLSEEGGLVINLATNIKSSDCLTTVGRFGDTEWARCHHTKEFICMKWHSQVKAFKLTSDHREEPRYNGIYLPVEGKLIENNVFYRLNTTSEDDTYVSVQETANGRIWRVGERSDGGNTWLSKRLTSNFPQRLGSEWKIGHFAEDAEAVEANLEEYDAWGKFGEWELCSEDCGDGTRRRSRECIGRVPGSYLCPGLARQTEECKTRDCPPDSGVWKSWGGWTPCSVTCGEGNRRRWRVCGRYGRTGGACQGSSSEVERCSTPCPATKTSYSDKEYLIFRIQKNFDDARDACQNLGGDLALVKTEMIQNALSPIIVNLGRTPFSYGYFIGMTDKKQEGSWLWIDDADLTYTNWNPREPNNSGNEDCGSMFRNGQWNDLACWRKTYYICERDMDPCSDTVCLNEGRCVADSNLKSYECQCPSYTRGDHCERIFNPCWNSSCQSGNCHSRDGYYYCVCPENSFGLHCDNVVQCPKPRIEDIIQLLGNNQQDEYDVETRLKFSCRDIEQTIEGYDEITCRRDGTWNKSPPNTCETPTCPSVTAPANGRIAESANRVHVRGSTIAFECNGGYEVEGRESIRCRDDYTWDGSVPTCRERKCPDVSNPQNGRFLLESGNRFARSSTLRLECDEGYEVDGNDLITCRDDYTWSHSRPSCRAEVTTCPALDKPDHGRWGRLRGNLYAPSSQLNLRCDDGYQVEGNEVITCQDNFTWTQPLPFCKERNCILRPQLLYKGVEINNNGREEFLSGESLNVTCAGDLVLSMDGLLSCSKGRWTPKYWNYLCNSVCGRLQTDGSFTITPFTDSYEVGSEVTFECVDDTQSLNGNNPIRCGEDGQWVGTIPTTCQDPN